MWLLGLILALLLLVVMLALLNMLWSRRHVQYLELRLRMIEVDVDYVLKTLQSALDAVIRTVYAGGVVSESSVEMLRFSLLSEGIPPARQFFTDQHARMLWNLLNKSASEYTLSDIDMLTRILELLELEFRETRDERYLHYAVKLRMYLAAVSGLLLKRGITRLPPPLRDSEQA